MAGEDDDLDIHVAVTGSDKAARDLDKVADSSDRLGDSSKKATPHVEGLSEAEEELAASVTKVEKRLKKQEEALVQSRQRLNYLRTAAAQSKEAELGLAESIEEVERKVLRQRQALEKSQRELLRLTTRLEDVADATDEATDATREFAAAQDSASRATSNSEGRLKSLWQTMRGGGSTVSKIQSRLFGMGKFLGKWGIILSLAATGVAYLASVIETLGVAAFAGVAGLAPLTGMLIAYPSLIGAVVQGFAAFKLATAGMGELVKVLGDPNATAEQIEAATKNMSQNQVTFARALSDSADAWLKVRKNIGSRFFDDLDDTYRVLSRRYLPIVDKYLGMQADRFNVLAKAGGKYLASQEGQSLVSDIMADNVVILDRLIKGTGFLGLATANMVRAAGPMLRRMGLDYENLGERLADTTGENQDRLEAFFERSYDLFLKTGDVLGSYMRGFYNIGRQSSSLSKFMGNSLEDLGNRFEEWTSSRGGKKDIRQYFREMIPLVREAGYWFRDLGKAFADITMDNDDFLSASIALRTKVLPALVETFQMFSSWLVPAIEGISDTYKNYKEGGVVGGFGRVLRFMGDAVQKIGELVAALPDFAQKILAFVTALLAAYGLANRLGNGAGSRIASALTGGRIGGMAGVQKVWVVNMLPGGGMGGPGGVVAGGGRPGSRRAPGSARTGGIRGIFSRGTGTRAAPRTGGGLRMPKGGFGIGSLLTSAGLLIAGGSMKGDSAGSGFVKGALEGAGYGSFFGPWGMAIGGLANGIRGSINGQTEAYQQRVGTFSTGDERNTLAGKINDYNVLKNAIAEVNEAERGWMRNQAQMTGEPSRLQLMRENLRTLGREVENEMGVTIERWMNMDEASQQVVLNRMDALKRLEAVQNRLKWDAAPKPFENRSAGKEAQIAGATDSPGATPNAYKLTRESPQYLNAYGTLVDTVAKRMNRLVQSGDLAQSTLNRVLNGGKGIIKQIDALPPQVVTKIATPGAIDSIQDVKELSRRFDLTPKQKQTLFKVLGTEEGIAAAERLQTRINNLRDKTVQINVQANVDRITRMFGGNVLDSVLFAGGSTQPGRKYLTGEVGTEVWMSKSGAMKMLGSNGPEVVSPGHGAVIPASAVSNPESGNYGNSPAWAQRAFKAAMANHKATSSPHLASVAPKPKTSPVPDRVFEEVNISVGPVYANSEVDVEAAVRRAWKKIKEDEANRR